MDNQSESGVGLLLCPFCGGMPRHVQWLGPLMQWRVKCNQCDALIDGHSVPASAVAAWNTRATNPTTGWRSDVEAAPAYTDLEVRAGHMTFFARYDPQGAMDDQERICGQWQATYEGEHPPCWSDGCCWENNADEIASLSVSAWRLPPPPTTPTGERG